MKLISKISLDEDEQEILINFVALLETVCSNRTDCSECPIFEACHYPGNLPEALDLLLSEVSTENS